jgi:hypothetical protein
MAGPDLRVRTDGNGSRSAVVHSHRPDPRDLAFAPKAAARGRDERWHGPPKACSRRHCSLGQPGSQANHSRSEHPRLATVSIRSTRTWVEASDHPRGAGVSAEILRRLAQRSRSSTPAAGQECHGLAASIKLERLHNLTVIERRAPPPAVSWPRDSSSVPNSVLSSLPIPTSVNRGKWCEWWSVVVKWNRRTFQVVVLK